MVGVGGGGVERTASVLRSALRNPYRVTSLANQTHHPRALQWDHAQGAMGFLRDGRFLISEVPLYAPNLNERLSLHERPRLTGQPMGYILDRRTRSESQESCVRPGFKPTIRRSRNDKWSGIGAVFIARDIEKYTLILKGAAPYEQVTPVHPIEKACAWTAAPDGRYRDTSLIRKRPPPRGPRHRATVGSYGEAFSYERGTPA